ncbi:hypothetical protein BDZ45DRAFT_742485 [Acephala macrosclerotiorum]|nr:hypothetical protein BDZ45DRAFT_742485 [Acephala macrosclerotiorum]
MSGASTHIVVGCHRVLLHSKTIPLSQLIQPITFRTVLTIFFLHVARWFNEDGRLNDNEVELISEKINTLWYDSNSPWRVFCATYFPARWSSLMRDREMLMMNLEPTFPWGFFQALTECWHKVNDDRLDVQMIIAETLRLYPPNRRMTSEKWEPDPLKFRPKRLVKEGGEGLDISETAEYIPFRRKVDMRDGTRTHSMSQCPSRMRGGPKLIAILVSALLEMIDDEW